MIKLIPKAPETELLNIFGKFFKDEQDSVRMQGIDSCVVFAKQLNASVNHILMFLILTIESKFILDALY